MPVTNRFTLQLFVKSCFIPLFIIAACQLAGCQEPQSRQHKSLSLQAKVERNTEKTVALEKQYRASQQELTEALITVCDELRALKTTAQRNEAERQRTIADLLSQQKHQKQLAVELAANVAGATADVKVLSENLATLSAQLKQQQKVGTQVKALSETQGKLQTNLQQLEKTGGSLAQKISTLQESLTQSQKQLVALNKQVEAFKNSPKPQASETEQKDPPPAQPKG